MAVATPSNLNPSQVRTYWDTKLQQETLFRDIFSRLRTVFDRVSNIPIPMDALVLEINAQANQNFRSCVIGWHHALDDPPRQGDLQLQLGFEETLRQKSQEVYFNEFSHAAATWEYGMHAHDLQGYGIGMPMATQLLGNYMEELFGMHYRQALLQRRSAPLTFSPVFQNQLWNPQWYVKNATTQPAYSPTLQTHTNNISTSLLQAGVGVNATLDADYLTALHYQITMQRIEPLRMPNGQKGFILTVPPRQKYHTFQMDRADNLMGFWTSVARMNDMDKANFPDLLGRWMNIWLVEDERAPTITLSGTAAPFTLTPGYVHPGNNDQRDLTNDNQTWDVGFLLGRAPLIDYYPVKIHHEYDDYNYKKWQGKGAFCMRGINLRMYDNPTATANSWEQRYSIVCPFGRGTVRA